MSYKIAVVSLDGKNIDLSFGAADFFYIYEVSGNVYHFTEKRETQVLTSVIQKNADETENSDSCNLKSGCDNRPNKCGTGLGCQNMGGNFKKVELISDCRCVVCKKLGFNITKQLEKKAISGFDVECTVEEALTKIVNYFDKVDSHQSLRGLLNANLGKDK